jgi:hypothetical protein
MKKVMVLMLVLFTCPIIASVNCLDNSQHLTQQYDDKEWHSVACDCPCTTIKGGHCIECGHLQNASTYTVVLPTKTVQNNKVRIPKNPRDVLRKLAFEYLQNKK